VISWFYSKNTLFKNLVPYVAVPSSGIIISIVSLHLKCCFAQLTGRGAAHMSSIDA